MRVDAGEPDDVAHMGARYLAEVAYVDEQVGVLLGELESRGVLDEALVVITADHGETLGNDPRYAYSHGSNVDEDVMHVPLLMRGYGMWLPEGEVVRSQVAMPGLAPTIERVVGLERTLGSHPDFWDLLRPGPVWDADGWPERPTRVVFTEASRPRQAEAAVGWNNLPLHRGVFAGGYGGTFAPWLQQEAPAWYPSSAPGDAAVFQLLVDQVEQWDARAPPHRDPPASPATQRALKALGYVD